MEKGFIRGIIFVLFEILIVTLIVGLNFFPTPAALASGIIDRYSSYYLSQNDQEPKDGAIKVTFFGTTMLLFDDGETRLMLDGYITRPSLISRRIRDISTDPALVDAALARAQVDKVDALFVAHSHFDHALDIAYIAQKTGAHLYGSESTLNIGRGGDLPEEQMTLYEPGSPVPIGKFTVTVLPSKHSPPVRGVNDNLGMVIDHPLRQPADFFDYVEGGSFDFLIQHGDHAIFVKPAANYIEGALDQVRADVLFLATETLGNQDAAFREAFYEQTVAKVQPTLVIPVHWDNFNKPLSDSLTALTPWDLKISFDFLIPRLMADQIRFGIMQGFQSILLFDNEKNSS
ncbi:MAG: MBL fold metallo-hydrolase [Elainella sp. C42_A2020_010]|nr:MBL fold metallo-hydrolase [Elainella sp. C42_A2020_010]